MTAPRIITVPLLTLAFAGIGLGIGAGSATAAEPFPQDRSASAVPFGAPFSNDPFYTDFYANAQGAQERAAETPATPAEQAAAWWAAFTKAAAQPAPQDTGWFAYAPLCTETPACPAEEVPGGGLVDNAATADTSVL
ncbi:hypothetical protein [Streptomyces sp. NPDC050738]|uniref:hypothetical protein n=1 Tax=Streptomyces sp. NPDC050738 TaxID=3154744 RepID=UPI00344956F9